MPHVIDADLGAVERELQEPLSRLKRAVQPEKQENAEREAARILTERLSEMGEEYAWQVFGCLEKMAQRMSIIDLSVRRIIQRALMHQTFHAQNTVDNQ